MVQPASTLKSASSGHACVWRASMVGDSSRFAVVVLRCFFMYANIDANPIRKYLLNRAIRDVCVCECMQMMFVHLIFTGYKVAFPSAGRKVTIWVVNQQHKLLHVI